MAIAPVSSVSFRNNYNQINFEGKKKEHTHSKMTNALKSVPLAALIAMSPLNMQAEDIVVARVEIENADAVQEVGEEIPEADEAQNSEAELTPEE